MRVNVYNEELTDDVRYVWKKVGKIKYYGVQLMLHMPVTRGREQVKGPFMHRPGDDDSSAVTFWSDAPDRLESLLKNALAAMKKSPKKSG